MNSAPSRRYFRSSRSGGRLLLKIAKSKNVLAEIFLDRMEKILSRETIGLSPLGHQVADKHFFRFRSPDLLFHARHQEIRDDARIQIAGTITIRSALLKMRFRLGFIRPSGSSQTSFTFARSAVGGCRYSFRRG